LICFPTSAYSITNLPLGAGCSPSSHPITSIADYTLRIGEGKCKTRIFPRRPLGAGGPKSLSFYMPSTSGAQDLIFITRAFSEPGIFGPSMRLPLSIQKESAVWSDFGTYDLGWLRPSCKSCSSKKTLLHTDPAFDRFLISTPIKWPVVQNNSIVLCYGLFCVNIGRSSGAN